MDVFVLAGPTKLQKRGCGLTHVRFTFKLEISAFSAKITLYTKFEEGEVGFAFFLLN